MLRRNRGFYKVMVIAVRLAEEGMGLGFILRLRWGLGAFAK